MLLPRTLARATRPNRTAVPPWLAVAVAGVASASGLVALPTGDPEAREPGAQRQTGAVRLPFQAGAVIGRAGVVRGLRVAPGGDVNGDGRPDLLAGAPRLDGTGRRDAGGAIVRFLGRVGRHVAMDPSRGGLRIIGPVADGRAGGTAFSAGDVNGDGLDDVALSARGPRAGERSLYVVFGRRTSGTIDLARLGASGYRVDIPSRVSAAPPVSGGDVNGDGRSDLLVPWASDAAARGSLAVVFGKASSSPVHVTALGSGGFHVNGFESPEIAAAAAGDVDADGRGDFLFGANEEDTHCLCAGGAGLLMGKADSRAVDISASGRWGVSFRNADTTVAVAGPGDVDGDRRRDLLVSTGVGVHVVSGAGLPRRVDLARLGRRGYLVRGVSFDVAGLGDLNGDRLGDFAAGRYVVYGSRSRRPLRRGRLGKRGFRVDHSLLGPDPEVRLEPAGDIDRDRHADVLVVGVPLYGPYRELDSLLGGRSGPLIAIAAKRNRRSPPRGVDLRASKRGTIAVGLLCPATAARRCRGRVTIRHSDWSTTRRFSAAAGRESRPRVTLPARLLGRRILRIRARAVARDARGRRAVTRRQLRVRVRR